MEQVLELSEERSLSQWLAPEKLRKLSQLNPIVSSSCITLEWLSIFFAMWICTRVQHPLLYLAVVIWIGARQHALGVLMHEGAHHLLFRHKRLNDWVAELLLAWPIFGTMHSYRARHFEHHRYTNTAQDPDWVLNRPGDLRAAHGWRRTMSVLLGLNRSSKEVRRLLGSFGAGETRRLLAARLLCYGFVGSIVALLHLWQVFLMFWVVPLMTWGVFVMRLRGLAEHFAVEGDHVFTESRTTYPSWFERLLIAPHHVNYHIEHHLYPSVPFYHLPQLHALLKEHAVYQQRAHITRSYWRVLLECIAVGLAPDPEAMSYPRMP